MTEFVPPSYPQFSLGEGQAFRMFCSDCGVHVAETKTLLHTAHHRRLWELEQRLSPPTVGKTDPDLHMACGTHHPAFSPCPKEPESTTSTPLSREWAESAVTGLASLLGYRVERL